jgi:hypothetical protein
MFPSDAGPAPVPVPSEPVLVAAIPVDIQETLSMQKPVWRNGYVPPESHAQNHQAPSDGPQSSALGSTHHQQMQVMADINHLNHIPSEEKLDDIMQQSYHKCTNVKTYCEVNRTSVQFDKWDGLTNEPFVNVHYYIS